MGESFDILFDGGELPRHRVGSLDDVLSLLGIGLGERHARLQKEDVHVDVDLTVVDADRKCTSNLELRSQNALYTFVIFSIPFILLYL